MVDWEGAGEIERCSATDVFDYGVEGAGGFGVGDRFFVEQGFEVLVVLDFRLHLQELLLGKHDELLASVFLNDLWMDAHGGFSTHAAGSAGV